MFRQAFLILGRSLWELWDNVFVLVVANLLWSLSLVPAMASLSFAAPYIGSWPAIAVAAVTVLFLTGPATLSLYELTLNANRRERLELMEFFRSYRTNYWRGFKVGLMNVIFVVLAFVNLTFYSSLFASNSPLGLAVILWAYIVFIWFTMQFHMWPLGVRMDKFSMLGLLRNSFLATFKYPVLSLVLGIVVGLFFFLSGVVSFLPIVIFGMSYHALVGNKALNLVLDREQVRNETKPVEEVEANPFTIEAKPLPPKPEPAAPKPFTTRNAPQGVRRRGAVETPDEEAPSKL